MLFVNTPVYMAILVLSTAIIAYFGWLLYVRILSRGDPRARRRPAAATGAGGRRRAGQVPAGRRARPSARMRVNDDSEASADEETPLRRNSNDGDTAVDQADAIASTSDSTPKTKIGTKKAAKLAEKERRKEEREAEERYREHQRKLEDQEIAKRKKTEEEEARAAAAEAAAEAKRREEEAAREQAEYERMKQEFVVEEEGTETTHMDNKTEEQLNTRIIASLKEAKIMPVEHLALELDMKTDACVDKIRYLVDHSKLSGVLDDRGKFIYISSEEYEAIAKFIELRGRVTLKELVENGHKLVNLTNVYRQ